MPNENKDIALQAWEIYQGLVKTMGDNAWKVNSLCLTLSIGLIAYSYTSGVIGLYLVVSFLALMFFFMESGYRRLQDQYIERSNKIELTLNDFLANEKEPRFPDSIGTDLSTPSIKDLLSMLKLNRYMFWLPYTFMIVVPIVLWFFEIHNNK